MITIYTDGSSRGNPGPGGWGVVIFNNDQVIELGNREEHTTNNRMELSAAINALEFLSKLKAGINKLKVVLYADSEYVTKGMTEWIEGWQKKNWRTAGKKPVLNKDLWLKLLEASSGKEVEWKYVAGHSGHSWNERADMIATSFADNVPIDLYNGPKNGYKLIF
ncbi:MAG: Ribonuclease H [Parcubacteria group bacterium GW2011_GWB1_38_8]|uniref:Ribonuclease H n=1 Tax=Candidatus Zambryskibacteria bacterium RIFCSPLOWO2_02_FULL_39_14 TaxID=1802769 RepID=A0A1G2UFM9_9BACT|nr:MAG: Ribonuclease H [Parcubacteria group bacterium GW2011_GWB1_38_8]OHA94739.1 MAG: ribonuclease HI [Candidatus Zambryskibacteria bacterium RIFCSPHIGHO2_02_FULL_39_16]OHB08269.1 MAG: ribonuclease HI [Candidatus Zambryskibacteria bacterium RIFCSPLOWO2_02_FULL_39_14]